jgi:Xaa-Pro aminopeptidase
MSDRREALYKEIDTRITKAKEEMLKRGYDGLVVYGDNKVCGSLRYLTDYFPDRAGWISLGPDKTYLFEGSALVIPADGEPVLMMEPGLLPGKEIHSKKLNAGGFSIKEGEGLTGQNIVQLLKNGKQPKRIGIESYDRFPLPIYLGIKNELPDVEVARSTIVEEMRMVKSPLELEIMKEAAAVADLGSQTVFDMLKNGFRGSELELIRACEHAMRSKDPIYEDSCTGSPSLICSGTSIRGAMLHLPDPDKKIQDGDVVHWDIALRYFGYPIDTSRTRVIGKATDAQKHAYGATRKMLDAVLKAAKPGVNAHDLVVIADKVAREDGYELWDKFLGHGLGLDTHERPDLVVEETKLQENMILAIEPRIAVGNELFGIEEMVHVTADGGVPLTKFPNSPLEIL